MPDTPTNLQIRQRYVDLALQIPELNRKWMNEGIPAAERAMRAWQWRREVCRDARETMSDRRQVELLRRRNIKKYGDPDGPSFEYLYAKEAAKGLTENDIYEAIILSASRTNSLVNARFGL